MPRSNPYFPAFNGGEVSPRLHARTDHPKYRAWLETCLNLIPLSEGAIMRRSGSRYVTEVADSAVMSKLQHFVPAIDQAYMLEFGANLIRFNRFQGKIVAANTDAAITNGTFDSGITDWDDISNGTGSIAWDSANADLDLRGQGSGNEAIAQQDVTTTSTNVEHVLKFRVRGLQGDEVSVRVGSASGGSQFLAATTRKTGYHCIPFTPTSSPFYVQFVNGMNKTVSIDDVSLIDNAPIEIGSPWPAADVFDVDGPQSADVHYLFHSDHPTHKLERRANTNWSLVEVEWLDGPYLTQNATATTLSPAATTGLGVLVTASAQTGINDDQGFLSTDVGRLLRISNPASGTNWGYGIVASRVSASQVTVDIKRAFAQAAVASSAWRLGSWSATTGYPLGGAFFEQRLFGFNTTKEKEKLWASKTADFENMGPDSANASAVFDGTVVDDDALDYNLNADDINAIFWASPGEDTIVFGTSGGQWVPTAQGAVLTPTDIVARRQTSHRCAQVQPIRIDHVVLFVQRAKRKVREFVFTFELDSYRAPNMSRLAEHVSRGGIVEMAYQEEPNSIVWAVRSDGVLLSMVYVRDEDVVNWGRHILGGSFAGGNPVVESVCVIPGANGAGQVKDSESRDEVWIIVKRTINGATKRYIEVLERDWETGDDQEDAYYADSLITYDGAAATTITGLSHLEGETVKVLGDGAVYSDEVVSGGQITIDPAASVVQVGLGYTHRMKTLKIEGGTAAGTAVGKTKRIGNLTFILLDSHTLSFGPDEDTLLTQDFRVIADPMDAAAPLFTGEKSYSFPGGWTTDSRIVVEEDDPVPFTLLAMAPHIDINEMK